MNVDLIFLVYILYILNLSHSIIILLIHENNTRQYLILKLQEKIKKREGNKEHISDKYLFKIYVQKMEMGRCRE